MGTATPPIVSKLAQLLDEARSDSDAPNDALIEALEAALSAARGEASPINVAAFRVVMRHGMIERMADLGETARALVLADMTGSLDAEIASRGLARNRAAAVLSNAYRLLAG